HKDIIPLLLWKRIDGAVTDGDYASPLQYAATFGKHHTVKVHLRSIYLFYMHMCGFAFIKYS
ncbi:hypothetical protein MKW94_011313, partial [Papaver nudicaule]|nr:hypothetical protein [Papaver nudicaule]